MNLEIFSWNIFKPKNEWLTIELLGKTVWCNVEVKPFKQATIDNPSSGGIENFKLLKIEYDRDSLMNFLDGSELSKEIRSKIISKYRKL